MEKVIIVGPAWPLRGGIAKYNERMAQEFASNGSVVQIETFKRQYPSVLFPGKTQRIDAPQPEDLDISVEIDSIAPLNWSRVGKKISAEQPDLVIFRYWMPFFAPSLGKIARVIKKNTNAKIVCLVDNLIPHETMPFQNILTKYFVRSMDGFVAMTDAVRTDIRSVTDKPVLLHPHPLFDDFAPLLSKENAAELLSQDASKNYLLFFGLVRKYKGLDLLLRAFAQLKDIHGKYHLIIAGEFYDKVDQYHKLIHELNLADNVTVYNQYIPDEEINRFFSISDVLILPYRSATQSGVTQIAYHYNKPMIVTEVGGLPEVVPHEQCGFVCPTDVDGIAQAIKRFTQLPSPDFFLDHIKSHKKQFSWDGLIQTFKHLYDQLSEH